jgi:hypothetical protein
MSGKGKTTTLESTTSLDGFVNSSSCGVVLPLSKKPRNVIVIKRKSMFKDI